MRFTICIAFIIHTLIAFTQEPSWVTNLKEQNARVIAMDHYSTNQLIAIKKIGKDYRIISIDKSNGDTSQVLRIGGGYYFNPKQIKSDQTGHVIIAGTYKKEMRIGTYERKSNSPVMKSFLVKFKPGSVLDTNNILHFNDLVTEQLGILPNNEIVMSGMFRYGANVFGQELKAGLDDIFIMKLTPSLQLGWVKNYGEGNDETGTAMHITDAGDIIMSAKIKHKLNLGNDRLVTLSPGINAGALLWKMNVKGNIIWHKAISTLEYGKISIQAINSDDENIYFAFNAKEGFTFNNDTIYSTFRKDVFLGKINHSGNNSKLLRHLKNPTDPKIAGLGVEDNMLHLVGTFQKRIGINDQLYYANGDTNRYKNDIFHFSLNLITDSHSFSAIGSKDLEQAYCFLSDPENIYISGTFDKGFNWDDNTFLNSNFGEIGFIVALGTTGQTSSTAQDNVDGNSSGGGNDSDDGGGISKPPRCPTPDRPMILSIKEETHSLTVRWREIDRAQKYELLVANDITMKDVVRSYMQITPGENPTYTVSGLEPDHQYYVQVFVENDCPKRAKSNVRSTKTKPLKKPDDEEDCEAPDVPNVYSSDITNSSAKITCLPVDGALKYKLVVANDQLFSSVIFKKEYTAVTGKLEQSITGLRNGQRYYYYVTVENDCPESTRSKTKSFFTLIGGATAREGDCNPTPPVITNLEIENYAFTADWASIPEVSHYNLYVSETKGFEDTIYFSKDLKFNEQPHHRVNKLKGKHDYFFNIVVTKKCKESTAIARSLTEKITTTCNNDTIIMEDPNENGPLLFQLVDCEGNLIKMGSIIEDTLVLIDSTANDPAGILKPLVDSTIAFKVGHIDLKASGECDENQRRVPIQQIGDDVKYECVEIVDPTPDSPCMDLATDRERLICLAKEGVSKAKEVEKEVKRVYEEMMKLSAKAKLETTTASEKTKIEQKVFEELHPEHQTLVDSIDKVRTLYEQMMNAIVMNGNIAVPVKSEGAGITISPEAVGVYVHWNKYDESWKLPGPQLVVEVKVSDFPNKIVKVGRIWHKLYAMWNIRGRSFDKNDNPISGRGEGLYGFGPCKAVRGVNSWAIAVLEEYENMAYQKFWDPQMKHFNANVYSQCTVNNLIREHAQNYLNHQIMSSLFQAESAALNIDQIGFYPNHLFLASTSKIEDVKYTAAFNAYYHAMEKMSEIYYKFYERPSITFHILQNLRLKVEKQYEEYWYESGYRIYYGLKEVKPAIAQKVKKGLE